ncbi:hypothetical protein [Asticcacaulis benevestitus]|uniref:Lipoprotein n=1 Tax=Asticcacaulis benevestitus DSM 16100 = ATCC BAA-896 TaxID=1121022 RepID=V4QUF9_9CAUL|nr:hypothetical protein [Asticcacaulis benevestitus]ESQ82803.1 hypothetical protein ABENE_20650 [Asticcacaulis benevestitus DSM 16100 = ATCC BAA-896]
MKRFIQIVATLSTLSLISGCGGSETHVSFGGKANGQPVFCISAKPNCAAPGAPLRNLQVEQVDEAGKLVRVMWRIDAPAGWGGFNESDRIIYGVLPVGWTTKTPPTGLTYGQHYRVNKQYGFSITANGLIMQETGR